MRPPHRKLVRHLEEPGQVHELTFSCYRRLPLLTNDFWRECFCESVDRAVGRHDDRLFAFVIMPEHVHLLVPPRQDASSIATLLSAVKRPCSGRIKRDLLRRCSPLVDKLTVRQRPGVETFRFWQEGPGYDRNFLEPRTMIRGRGLHPLQSRSPWFV